ncbi:MAG: hypothetical protein H7258_00530 [Ferruginibacter sp.]|nr:hypothetical protein [Ferruginibacter sp.]
MELILISMYHSGGKNVTIHIDPPLKALCFTIELPGQNNDPEKSCIPEGKHAIKKRIS